MSLGALARGARTLNIAMNRSAPSRSGEGGEDPAAYTPRANGDNGNSPIKQMAKGGSASPPNI